MSSHLEIRLFGGIDIALNGISLTDFMSNKAPALLIYLALHRLPQQRDALATLLWSEMSDADAKNNLRQVLTNLRKVVDAHLVVTRESIGFNHESSYELDVAAFEQALQSSRTQAGQLRQAAMLYKGEFLAGFYVRDAPDFEEWMLAQRARLSQVALYALHELTQLALGHGRFGEAIESAGRLLAIDPWREEAHRQLMLALARSGQRSAALNQFKKCQQTLSTELSVEPSPNTRALYERIRAAGESVPHQLPAQPTSFVGRWHELNEIEQSLLNIECRMLTVLGVGGIGKTRLALQAANQLLQIGAFLNGIFFVPLAGLDSPSLLAPAMAEACGFGFSGNADPQTQLIDYLHNQEVLLLLDNFEHLLDAVPLLNQILQRAPLVKILVTSRTRLQTRWEWLLELEGLDEPNTLELFNARATVLSSHFVLDAQNQEMIRQIGRLVQGLPLGIELAAAAVRHFSCAEIAASLAETLDLLTTQMNDVPSRHRSIPAVFDYSLQRLSSNEQQLFLLLSLFHGGFQLAAIQAIWSTAKTQATLRTTTLMPLLTSLIDQSLLQRNKEGRFQLHELVRQYANEKLQEQPELYATALQSHTRFYARFLADRYVSIGSSRQRETLHELEVELDNIRAAWQWTIAHQSSSDLALMVEPFFEYFEVRSQVQEAAERFGQALESLRKCRQEDPLVRQTMIKVLNRQARFLTRLGQRSAANQLLEECIELAQHEEDLAEVAMAYNYQGLILQSNGDYQAAIKRFEASIQLCQQIADHYGAARALNNLGVIQLRMGDYATAQRHLDDALSLRRRLDNPKLIADSLNNLGILQHELGNFTVETNLLNEALQKYRQLEDRKGISVTLHNLGGVHLALKEFEQARIFLEEALEFRRFDPAGLSNTLNNLGAVALRAGDLTTAETRFCEALRAAQTMDDRPMALDILVGIADIRIQKGQVLFALQLLSFVLPQAQDSDTRDEAERLLVISQGLGSAPHDDSLTLSAIDSQASLADVINIVLDQVSFNLGTNVSPI